MYIEFLMQEWKIAAVWLALALILFLYEKSKSGKPVSAQEIALLVNKQDGVIVDIRDKAEFNKGHITDSRHIPLSDLAKRAVELESYKDKPVIVVCKMGASAGGASKQLRALGFTQVYKLTGGISEWTASSLPLVKK